MYSMRGCTGRLHHLTSIPSASVSVVITSDEGVRGGRTIPLKATVDDAVEGCDCVKKVFVSKRTGAAVPMYDRDVPLEEVGVAYVCTLWILPNFMAMSS